MGFLVAALLLGTGLTGRPATAEVSEAVEDLLWDLQLVPLVGDPPPLALPGLDGRIYSLAEAKGQVVLFYFWATW